MSGYDPQHALAHAIMRATDADRVEFPADDPSHVWVHRKGAKEILRYQLGTEAQQFLAGEFPELPPGGIAMWLHAPRKDESS